MRATLRQLLRSMSARTRRAEGTSLVEFALVSILFFTLMFAIIDFGRVFFVQMTIQHALRQAGRYAVTGNSLPGTNPQTQSAYTRVESIIETAKKAAAGVDVSNIIISAGGLSGFAGNPGDTVTVSLTSNLNILTPLISKFFTSNGIYTFTASTTFKNEPFPQSQTY